MSDYTVGDTLYFSFTTRSFTTGAPTQLAGTPVVSAYENADLTQITAGITLGVDHDSVTGLNMLTIVASGANGFESGKDYNLVITTGTVGGVSVVGETVGRFTLGRSAAAVDLANGTDGLGALKSDTAAALADTNELQTDWVNGGRLDLILDIIAADTTTDIPALIAALNNLSSADVTAAVPTAAQNADGLLGRNVAGGSSTGRLVKEALYVLRNKTDIAAGTLTVYGVDDTTAAFTAAVSTTAGDPISQIDPA